MTFSLHQGGVEMLSQIAHGQSPNIHPLAHLLGTYADFTLFQKLHIFYSWSKTASCNSIPPLSSK